MLEQMIRTNLVPLVRRVRQAVDEVEEVGQDGDYLYGIVRTVATENRKP
jgi:hypothetical protein